MSFHIFAAKRKRGMTKSNKTKQNYSIAPLAISQTALFTKRNSIAAFAPTYKHAFGLCD